MARIHTLNNISNPNPPPRTVKERYCPGMKSPWRINPTKFDPRNRDTDDRNRRICMLITLVSEAAHSAVSLFLTALSLNPLVILVHALLALVSFFFLASMLVTIGDAEGVRIVLGRNIGRWHFDVFLVFCACVYGSLFLATFFGMHALPGFFLAFVPIPMFILLFGVAWIATWDTTPVSLA